MTIKMIADMFFAQYNEVDINVRMEGGLRGRYERFTKDSFYERYKFWLDEEVILMDFQTHYIFNDRRTRKCERPMLFMMYAE